MPKAFSAARKIASIWTFVSTVLGNLAIPHQLPHQLFFAPHITHNDIAIFGYLTLSFPY
jgi:hypothetical protein